MSKAAFVLISILLTWIAGFVDAVGFIALGHIYTANMSGNSIAVGIQAFARNWPEMLIRLWPVAAYVAGLLLCRLLLEFGARERVRRIATFTLALEILLLVLVTLGRAQRSATSVPAAAEIGLLALAMGIQNGTLTHFSLFTVHTGFVTGTLVKMAEEFARYAAWLWDKTIRAHERLRDVIRQSPRQQSLQRTISLVLLWIAYVLGAFSGALGMNRASIQSLWVPIVSLFLLICLDSWRPLAVREEEAQVKGSGNVASG